MHITNFLEIVERDDIYVINNNSSKNIVLFGNCHMSTIGFYLNSLLNYKFNIHIIISYISWRSKQLTEENINKIWETISKSNYFIYQKHYKNHNIDATNIDNYAKKEKILIPNLRLDYTDLYGNPIELDKLKNNFEFSYDKVKKNIESSDLNNFIFILENFRNIRFFDIPTHPTLYILYLLSLQIYYKIKKINHTISLVDYYQNKNDTIFIKGETIILGSIYEYKLSECIALDINPNSEYYGLSTPG